MDAVTARPVNEAVRSRVKALHADGKTRAEIARALQISEPMVGYHLRALGVPVKEYSEPASVRGGKRVCGVCGRRKSLGAFPSVRNAVCTMCTRKRRKSLEAKIRTKSRGKN